MNKVSEGHDACQPIGVRWIEPVLQAEDAPRTMNPPTVNPLAAKVRPVVETSSTARDEAAAVAMANIRSTTPSRGVGDKLGSLLESLPIPRFLRTAANIADA